ncbi:uncharacterized protein Z518_10506 [Rhinocladiella mackenziei CBS 650.93]|uniref:DUF6594 domain-containing protein n=1 Tax=Rhinocladiella mackenziei CBS 650.93 TaxID=1442369 RepID=A0A0D2FE68_9EURO|nr:uncharacterized protein Z518_10506 [Rhinocladiella mackenziei CBS 650.93]KIX00367.1 hypothetical protein Z518_10506 [Rhinocladiella mackenziei CBS 650.93]
MSSSPRFDCGSECTNKHGHAVYNNILRVADFMLQDPDNVVLKRFQYLQLVHLLSLQHKLADCARDIKRYRDGAGVNVMDGVMERLGLLLRNYDQALATYERIQCLQSTPRYVRKILQQKADKDEAPQLNVELRNEDGWLDLVSIASGADKGVIHSFVDRHNHWLSRLYRKNRGQDDGKVDLEGASQDKASNHRSYIGIEVDRERYNQHDDLHPDSRTPLHLVVSVQQNSQSSSRGAMCIAGVPTFPHAFPTDTEEPHDIDANVGIFASSTQLPA